MSFVPSLPHPWDDPPKVGKHSVSTITIHVQRSNARPVGFAPWPDLPKAKKRKKAKR